MALAYPWLDGLLYSLLPFLGSNIVACALVSFGLLTVPAFLIGCSVPLFATYLTSLRALHVFSLTYGIYNLGAALTALAMEFVLLRTVGLRAATMTLAALNGVVALGLLGLGTSASLIPPRPGGRIAFPRRVLLALAIAGVASAIFQLAMMKLSEFVFGPYNETFSLVLATVLLGLALGAIVSLRFNLSFTGALLISLVGIAWLLAFFPPATIAYAWLYPDAAESYPHLVALKFGLVVTLMGLPALGFGATIPSLLRTYKDVARESGQLLFWSSMANALGFLLMAFVLHRYLDYGPLLLLIAGLTATALFVSPLWRLPSAASALTILAISGLSYATLWDEMLLYIGHTNFHSTEDLEDELRSRIVADRYKGPQDVFAITWKDDEPYFFINGYISIPLSSESEKLVGALSAMLSPRLDEALVLGMGTGATAGTVGLLFDQTDVVEINSAVLDNLYRMAEYNFDIESRPRVNIVHDDGIHFTRSSLKRYSLILNTVTTPLYFSSSKLYTRDFLAMVRERLTPDGVYVTWMDQRIGDRGADIVLSTLATQFSSCWLNYMNYNYFLLACSNADIGVHQAEAVADNEVLRDFFVDAYSLPVRLLPYSVISTNSLALRSSGETTINTLDFPILEFEMARLQSRTSLEGFRERLQGQLDLGHLRNVVGSSVAWDPGEFLFHADLRISATSQLSRMLRRGALREFGSLDTAYDQAVLRLGEETGSAESMYDYGRQLMDRHRYPAAAVAFTRALDLDPATDNAHYQLARSYAASGDHDDAATHFLQAWELTSDDRIPLRLGRALIESDRYAEALPWLERAAAIEDEDDAVELAYYRGVAHEGLNRGLEAKQHYEEALRVNPSHRQALEALQRLESSQDERSN